MRRKASYALVYAVALALSDPSVAQQEPLRELAVDIRPQPIGDALNALAREAQVQILFYSAVVEGVQAPRLQGTFTLESALDRLLANTALRYEFISPGTIAIRPVRGDDAARNNAPAARSAPSIPSAAMERGGDNRPALTDTASDSTPRTAEGEPRVEELVVTGTRVPSRRLTEMSPVSVASFEEIRAQGAVNLEAVIRDIPSAAPGRSSTTNNGGNGNTTLNLRNLGEARTLILVNGKRMVSADFTGIADINSIPTKMIERIEVVTGGASAVYGSDAIAGVVNFILRDDFDGLETDVQYGAFDQGDGSTYDASILAGIDLPGKGNITANIGYTSRDPTYRNDRDWARTSLVSNGTRLVPFLSDITPGGAIRGSGLVFSDNRELVPDDGRRFNDAEHQFMVVPQERFVLGASGHFEYGAVEPYFRLAYTQNKVDRQLFGPRFIAPVTVNYGNPLLSAQERAVLFGPGPHAPDETTQFTLSRRFVESGNLKELNNYQVFQMVGGATGHLGADFKYDVSAQYGHTLWSQRLLGDISYGRFQQGLLVNANRTCIDPSGGCVPIDVFTSQPGALTREQARFFALEQQANSEASQFVATASVAGDLGALNFVSPWASEALALAVGVEYRKERAEYRPDDNLDSGNNVVFGSIPRTEGSISVRETFAEIRLPVVQARPGAQLLELNTGYRRSDYDLAGSSDAYKYGLVWAPLQSVRLRASFQRAVRAPNIGELFSPAQPSNDSGVDPCFSSSRGGPTASASLCQATGVPAVAYGDASLQCPSGQCTALVGGNLALAPERSDTRSFGVVLRPVPELSLTLDYFDIDVQGAISAFGATMQNVLNSCYGNGPRQNPTQDPNNPFCQQIVRDSAGRAFGGGRLISPDGYVSLLNANIGLLQTQGVDAELAGAWELSELGMAGLPGSLSLNVLGTHVSSYEQQLDRSSPIQQCAGTYGLTCGQPNPKWRATTRITYSSGNALSVSMRWRWIDAVTLDVDRLSGTVNDPVTHRLDAQSYLDLSARWNVSSSWQLRAGINNLLDDDPPLAPLSVAGASNRGLSNTFPATYDIGRQYFIGMTATF